MVKQDSGAASQKDEAPNDDLAGLSPLRSETHLPSGLAGQSKGLPESPRPLAFLEGQLRRLKNELAERNAELSKITGELKASKNLLADARAQSKSYSARLSQQTEKLAVMSAEDSELRAQLSWHLAEVERLSRRSLWRHIKDFLRAIVIGGSKMEVLTHKTTGSDGTPLSPDGRVSLIAFPREVPVSRAMGVTAITWNTGDGSEGQVCVSLNGQPETLFVTGAHGSKEATWILAGSTYEFRLYAAGPAKRLLNQVRVIGVRIPGPESQEVLRGSLDTPVADLSAPCLQLSGWAYSTAAPISRVEAFLDSIPLGLMKYGEPRPDVPRDTADSVPVGCGFSGRFLLDEFLVHPASLLVRITDERGNIKDLPPVAVGQLTVGQPESEPPGAASVDAAAAYDYGLWVKLFDTLTDEDREVIRTQVDRLSHRPLISVVMPVSKVDEVWLRKAVESVLEQLYPDWELCIADDSLTSPQARGVLDEYELKDSRIKVTHGQTDGTFAGAVRDACAPSPSSRALELVTGEFVALLDNVDELTPHALYMVAAELNQNPEADLIYSDEDKVDQNGVRREPHFKSDWNPDLLNSCNSISNLVVYRTTIIKRIGGFRNGFEGSQDYDLTLRFSEQIPETNIRHIPRVLYHRRALAGSVAHDAGGQDRAVQTARNAIRDHLERKGVTATVTEGHNYSHRVIYPVPEPAPLVSVIIATRDRVELLSQIVSGVLSETDYEPLEIIIVDNLSKNTSTLKYLREIQADVRVKVVEYSDTFNYSAINNLGFRACSGDVIALINNDISVISPGWLREMVSHAVRPGIGAVGARLLYPDETVQHAGVILGVKGVAAHAHRVLPKDSPGYFNRAMLIQNFSAVTGACIVLRREVFEEIGGLDEVNLSIALNDVDLCIRIREKGYLIVWTPYAELYHVESASRESDFTPETAPRFIRECEYMMNVWGHVLKNDPYYNPNLTAILEDFSLAVPPRIPRQW